jgi:hypothetical protein
MLGHELRLTPPNRLREKTKFASQFKLIWVVQSPLVKIFRFPFPPNQWLSCTVLAR